MLTKKEIMGIALMTKMDPATVKRHLAREVEDETTKRTPGWRLTHAIILDAHAKILNNEQSIALANKMTTTEFVDNQLSQAKNNYSVDKLREELLTALVEKSANFVKIYEKSLRKQLRMIETIIESNRSFTVDESRTFNALSTVTQQTINKVLPQTANVDQSTTINIQFKTQHADRLQSIVTADSRQTT